MNTTNDIFQIIDNTDFLQFVPEGASDEVTVIIGMLHIVKLVNTKGKSIAVPNNVISAYASTRKELSTTDLGYIGEAWANICGVNDGSITYKEHEEKGAELIQTLDRLLAEKLKEANKLH